MDSSLGSPIGSPKLSFDKYNKFELNQVRDKIEPFLDDEQKDFNIS